MNGNNDILQELFESLPASIPGNGISYTLGSKYVGAMGPDGHIGVCATLGVTPEPINIRNQQLDSPGKRIVANALINSYINYSTPFDGDGDIFTVIDFMQYKRIVMIGYFGSLVQKFHNKGISLITFDLDQLEMPIMPIEKQRDYLHEADCVVATSTSLGNGTFSGIVSNCPRSCDIYMLGPSTPLADAMFAIPQVKGLFGSIFKPYDNETLGIIAQGGGTRQFIKNMHKVYRLRR